MIRLNKDFNMNAFCYIQTENAQYQDSSGEFPIPFQKVSNFNSNMFQISGNKITIISDKVKYVFVEGMERSRAQSGSVTSSEFYIKKNGTRVVYSRDYSPGLQYSDAVAIITKTLIPVTKGDYFECTYKINYIAQVQYFSFCITAVF